MASRHNLPEKFHCEGLAKGARGKGHNMSRVRVCAAHMGRFLGQNSLNKGPIFGRFSMKMGGLCRNWRQKAKNGSFSAKIHHKSGYDSKFR